MRSFFSHDIRAKTIKICLRIFEHNPSRVFSRSQNEFRWSMKKAMSTNAHGTHSKDHFYPTKASVGFEVVKECMIKPSSPTPPSLQRYKLSLIDQLVTSYYVPLVLFFTKESFDTNNEKGSSILEKSLSKLLTFYYPFAGKLVGINHVECNDMGVVFREVRIDCSLTELLANTHDNLQDAVFPAGLAWGNNVPPNGEDSLMIVQLSHFDCGGIALGLCMSHHIGDAFTLLNFLIDWAAIARKATENPCPLFNGATIYPPIEYQDAPERLDFKKPKTHISTRILFDSFKIEHLKTIVSAKSDVKNPTRTEVVSALLTKSFLAASMVDSPSFKPIVLFLFVNLRSRTNAQIQEKSVGNFLCSFHIPVFSEEDMKLESLVAKIRSEKERIYKKYQVLNENERVAYLHEEIEYTEEMRSKVAIYNVTSVCGFPYQDLDFGWGKPLKVTYAALPMKNWFILVSDPTGKAVEVIATIEEKVLEAIHRDQEFLSFATLSKS